MGSVGRDQQYWQRSVVLAEMNSVGRIVPIEGDGQHRGQKQSIERRVGVVRKLNGKPRRVLAKLFVILQRHAVVEILNI